MTKGVMMTLIEIAKEIDKVLTTGTNTGKWKQRQVTAVIFPIKIA